MQTNRMQGGRLFLMALFAAGVWAAAAAARAQSQPAAAALGAPVVATNAPASDQIDIDAQTLDYDRKTGWAVASGNVVVRKGPQELRADRVRVNTVTEDVVAEGNVVLRAAPGEKPWTGTTIQYNFRTRESSAMDLSGASEPFHIYAKDSRRLADGSYVAHNANVSTCTNAPGSQHYHMQLRDVELTTEDRLKGEHAVLYFGPVPCLYLPFWHRDLNEDMGLSVRPGYNSRVGAFLLTSYRYPLTDEVLRGETHVDYRTKRGVGLGQDIKWRDPEGDWNGKLSAYGLDDQQPYDDDESLTSKDIDSQRYRVRFQHDQTLGDRDYALINLDYVSDVDLLEDFFEGDYRRSNQPENYAVYTYRGDNYTASLEARKRLNDFYDDLDRLPQLSVSLPRQEILDGPYYYGGQSSAGYLNKLWADGSSQEDYSAFRADSENTIYRPEKFFGFLNVTPRAGYRATYYSETASLVDVNTTSTVLTTNSVTQADGSVVTTVGETTQTNTTQRWVTHGADVRSLFQLGCEVSYKAFKSWEGGAVDPLRHVAEPYLNYTFVPEPDLMPDDLYQFDKVDNLGDQNNVKFGMRNKFQTKRNDRPYDLVDLDVYSYYRVEDEYGAEQGIDDVFADMESHPTLWLRVDMDTRWDTQEDELQTFNTQFFIRPARYWKTDVEYRYRRDSNSLLSADLTFFPTHNWDFNVYAREEFELSRLEEVGGYVQRNLDCMHVRTGAGVMPGYTRDDGTQKDDEYQVRVEIWLTAFPEIGIGDRHDH